MKIASGLLPEVEHLEAGPALGLLAAHLLAEVEPLRLDVGQRLDPLDRRAADVEDLEEGAAGARGEREHAGEHGQQDREAERERPQRQAAGRPPLEHGLECQRLERRRLGPGDLVPERAEAELELRHRSPPAARAAVRGRARCAT